MQEEIDQDVLDILESFGVYLVPINGRVIRHPEAIDASVKLCPYCGKPEHGAAACDVKF